MDAERVRASAHRPLAGVVRAIEEVLERARHVPEVGRSEKYVTVGPQDVIVRRRERGDGLHGDVLELGVGHAGFNGFHDPAQPR